MRASIAIIGLLTIATVFVGTAASASAAPGGDSISECNPIAPVCVHVCVPDPNWPIVCVWARVAGAMIASVYFRCDDIECQGMLMDASAVVIHVWGGGSAGPAEWRFCAYVLGVGEACTT